MSLREWLIVVGVVIILGILIDGLRRMRLAKQDSLKMSRDLGGQIDSSPLDDDFNPELPGGGVRVVSAGADSVDSELDEQNLLSISAQDDSDLFEPKVSIESDESEIEKPSSSKPKQAKAKIDATTKPKEETVESDSAIDHEVIVINVDAQPGQNFAGADVNKLLVACGMKHGEMSIFHRHEEDLLSPIQFSVANAVEPGYFDPDKLETLSTPGVSFFMSIPGPKNYLQAFDFMYETAKCFADNLQGELKDEHRSVLTSQTVEHYKQRIREFERKQLCKMRP
ncbi:hypothetical protein A3715_08875 [Oleiphilus sp. HI0009]|uniref:cell division protein ZipA n=1 Tax=unclassified Oleiphilus TaxID=2631174 RepID=UPI0007C39A78|nr:MULTISPECIES: cell division protein ZipA [unclassified Oleiphilus]KZX79245.1 hypothetical protein A3715_08875 [Oleiphilus sp. HI0009]KZY66062.1 hypothetical protein A3738_07385 [Oleiphilus sp. HI0066]KZY68682.1 hypothetical protein A3739_10685 [Oleiphilus sp. HI0067]KZY72883.1 hypothetical protein A3739_15520 [Oleiphilus sp. HI0067]